MQRRAKISIWCGAALVGIALASFQRFQWHVVVLCVCLGIFSYIVGKKFWVSACLVFLVAFGWLYLFTYLKSPNLASFEGQEITLQGKILSLQRDGVNTEALFASSLLEARGKVFKTHAVFNIKNNELANNGVGETVKISGNFFQSTETMQRYYFTKNISGDLYATEIASKKFSVYGRVQNILWRIHERCLQKLSASFSYPVDAMLGALLLGARTEVPKEITNAFKTTGTTHILALSGYNISIIFATIELMLAKFLKPKPRFLLAATFIAVFVLLVGPSSSIVRAAVMGILTGFVARSGRITSGVTVLLFASTIMVLLNPKILAFDVSFQLSALATFGIMAFQKNVEAHLKIIPNIFQAREMLATTISAQIPTMPILIYTFQSLSTISLLANILVLPLVPFIMATGFISLLLSFASLPLARLLAPLPSLLVNTMDGTLAFLARWQYSLLQLRIPVAVLVLYSLFVVAAFWYLQTQKHEDKISR